MIAAALAVLALLLVGGWYLISCAAATACACSARTGCCTLDDNDAQITDYGDDC
jgi:hypothetical protein